MSSGVDSNGFRIGLLAALLACFSTACGDRCLAFDYGPPSARLALNDGVTGNWICSRSAFSVSTSRGAPIAHEDTCEWWLPAWTSSGDAGANATESEVVVTVSGYQPQTVSLEVRRNECGEIQRPPLLQVNLEPNVPE